MIILVGQVCTRAQRTGLPGLALSTQEVLNGDFVETHKAVGLALGGRAASAQSSL